MIHAAAAQAKRTGRRRPQRTPRSEDERPAKASPVVLLVDDIEDNRAVYAEFFVDEGLRVVQAADGEHALMKVHAMMPDLVVMDLALPVMDGWEATRLLKAHARTKHIPVIALTGHVTPDNLRRARRAGADAVLTKPCTPDVLLAEIRKLLVRA